MGYLSSVAISFLKEDYVRLREKVNMYPECKYILDMENMTVKDYSETQVVLLWDLVKWYSDYKAVRLVTNFLDSCKCYAYIETGEIWDDVTEKRENKDHDKRFNEYAIMLVKRINILY